MKLKYFLSRFLFCLPFIAIVLYIHGYHGELINNAQSGIKGIIDFGEIFRHIAAILFMVYFVLICRSVGVLFVKKCGIVLDNPVANLVIPVFLGIIFLTYLFFVVGILKMLYFPLVFIILLIILLFGFKPDGRDCFATLAMTSLRGRSPWQSNLKIILKDEFNKTKKKPWRIIFLVILSGMLFYNFSYCFVPATFADGSGDVTNSYLPLLNDYILSHSFGAAIQNSTIGISSQAADVLRTVVKMFSGEPGVYLLSFVYIILTIAGVYLIGKELFNIKNMLIYLTVLLVLSANLFTEAIHFGKLHPAVLAFLLISLYLIRFSNHDKRYLLMPMFFAFLTSQYAFFVVVPLVYYLFVIIYDSYRKEINTTLKLHMKSLMIFCLLSPIFYLKLIIEVGTCFPTGMMSTGLQDFFLKINKTNETYKYIDNNYIRHFYQYHHLTAVTHPINHSTLKNIMVAVKSLDFGFILLFLPFLQKIDKYKGLYILETISLLLVFEIIFQGNCRLRFYYIFLIIILQFAIVNNAALKLDNLISGKLSLFKKCSVLLILFVVIFNVRSVFPYSPFPDNLYPLSIRFKRPQFLKNMLRQINVEGNYRSRNDGWYYKEILPVFLCMKSKYQYLEDCRSQKYFDHAMLIRQYTDVRDTILIVPVRYHEHTNRRMTARHALGSVIYQKDMSKIMADLKRLNINYLSTIPITYKDYNPFYTPIFEEDTFYKYFKLLFSDNGNNFYKIIYDGTNTEYSPSPYNVKGLPFIPMLKEDSG